MRLYDLEPQIDEHQVLSEKNYKSNIISFCMGFLAKGRYMGL